MVGSTGDTQWPPPASDIPRTPWVGVAQGGVNDDLVGHECLDHDPAPGSGELGYQLVHPAGQAPVYEGPGLFEDSDVSTGLGRRQLGVTRVHGQDGGDGHLRVGQTNAAPGGVECGHQSQNVALAQASLATSPTPSTTSPPRPRRLL